MDNLGFIVAAYVLTFVAVAGYAWSLWRRLRRLQRDALSTGKAPPERGD